MKSIALVGHQAFSMINFRSSLIRVLVDAGYKVYAFAPDYRGSDIRTLKSMGAEPIKYKLARVGMNPFEDLLSLLGLYSKLKKLKIDIILSFTVKPVIFGTIAAWFARIPCRICLIEGLGYVFTDSGDGPSLLGGLLKKITSTLYGIGLKRSTKAIFLNQDDIQLFVSQNLAQIDRVVNLGGIGVNLNEWQPSPLPDGPVTFILIGRLLKEKGLYEFVDAIREVRKFNQDARFIVIGGVDSNPGGISQDQIHSWVKKGLIEWPGHVNTKEWLAKSHVFVLPSYREGVPRSTQEAMAMGRPVITTDVPGCRDTVINGLNGYLVKPFNPKALADSMIKFIQSPELIAKMGAQSRKLAEQCFDEKQKNLEILKIIEDIPSRSNWLKRTFDICLAFFCLIIFSFPMILITLFIKVSDRGSAIYWSKRVGSNGQLFWMPKFRSMKLNTPVVASHLLAESSKSYLILGGSFLRKSSLDELPQLWSILKGDMSFVGPRPALFNQIDLIEVRRAFGIDQLKPGLTGWAQVNGRDKIGLNEKVRFDQEYLERQSLWFDIYILCLTFLKVLRREGITH